MAWRKSLHPDDLSRASGRAEGASGGENIGLQQRIQDSPPRAGSWKWIADSGKTYEWDDEGKPLRAAGTHLKILPRRKRAEQALRESETRFRQLIENAPEGVFVQTRGRFAYLNKVALRVFGAGSPDEIVGQPLIERIHPDHHAAVRERTRILNEEKRAVPPQDQVYLRLDGKPRGCVRFGRSDALRGRGRCAGVHPRYFRAQTGRAGPESAKVKRSTGASSTENAAEGDLPRPPSKAASSASTPPHCPDGIIGYEFPGGRHPSPSRALPAKFMAPEDRQRNIESLEKNDVLRLEGIQAGLCKDGRCPIWCRVRRPGRQG